MMHDMRDLQCLNVGITPGCYSVPAFRPFACARSRAPVSAVRARILPVRAGVAWRVVFVAWRVLAVHARISQLEFSLHGAFLNHFFGRERAVVWSGRWSISFPI